MSADLTAKPERRDIVNAYRLALGRDPESAAVVDDKLDQANGDWPPGCAFREDPSCEGPTMRQRISAADQSPSSGTSAAPILSALA